MRERARARVPVSLSLPMCRLGLERGSGRERKDKSPKQNEYSALIATYPHSSHTLFTCIQLLAAVLAPNVSRIRSCQVQLVHITHVSVLTHSHTLHLPPLYSGVPFVGNDLVCRTRTQRVSLALSRPSRIAVCDYRTSWILPSSRRAPRRAHGRRRCCCFCGWLRF